MLAVLVGLIDSISDFSLFRLGNFSHLDFLFEGKVELAKSSKLINAAVILVGVFSAIKIKRIWWIIALLPGLVQLALQIFILDHVLKLGPTGVVMSVLFKLTFLFFMFKGRIRSFSFLVFTILLASLVSTTQLVMFVLLACVGRFIFLVISQNLGILRGVSAKDYLRLLWRTVLRWSTILIFAVPGYLVTKYLISELREYIYDNTFVDYYHIDRNAEFEDLRAISVSDTLNKYGFSTEHSEYAQQNLESTLILIEDNIDSLHYSYPDEAVVDFHRVFELLQLGTSQMAFGSNEFVRLYIAVFVEHAVVAKMLPGRSEFEIDIELSAHDLLRKKEIEHLHQIDSINRSWQAEIDEKIVEIENKAREIEWKAQEIANYLDDEIESKRLQGLQKTQELAQQAKNELDTMLDDANRAISAEINTIPAAANAAFDRAVPETLTEVDSRFENADHEFYEIKPAAVNLMKGLLRDVYFDKRIEADSGVNREARALARHLNLKVDSVIGNVQIVLNGVIDNYRSQVDEGINAGTYAASEAVFEASVKFNKELKKALETVKASMREVKETVDDATETSKSAVAMSYRTAKATVSGTLLSLNYGLLFFGFVSDAVLLLLIIKSFCYVFSRVAFDERNALSVNIIDKKKNHSNGVINSWGSEYSIPVDNAECIFVSRKFTPTGRAPKISIPNWTSAVVARLKNRNYLMNAVEVRENETETVDFRSIAGAEFVEWDLAEGEEVVFNYENLVAFGESVQLSMHYSVRITSMMFGRARFYIAKGPGKLVLMTRGKSITNDSDHLVKSVAVDRIIAWQRSTEFSVDSELGMADVFFSDLYLKRTNDDLIIIDADPGNIKKNIGLAKFIKRFFLPI